MARRVLDKTASGFSMADKQVQTLETGNLFFFFRPRVEVDAPAGLGDVQQLYMVLSPYMKHTYRSVVIGRERLPDPRARGRERFWGFVDLVRHNPREIVEELAAKTYGTQTRGERREPAARPAGEGIYAIVKHHDHTHLAYALELPSVPGEVQDAFNIEPEASYIITVKNPEAPSPPRAGLPERAEADFPPHLREHFGGKRFADLDPPELLDHEGAEIVLVAASSDVRVELGLELHPEDEDASSADTFRELRLRRDAQPTKPLLEGRWD